MTWQQVGDVARDVTDNVRAMRIDAAVSTAGELIGALLQEGPVTSGQARLIVEATVRAAVPNAEGFEVRDSAQRIVAELEGTGANEHSSAG